MQQFKQLFKDSFHELKSTTVLTKAALLVAVTVALGFYRIHITEFLRIGFDFVPKEMTGMLFGPVVGGVVAGVSDVIAYFIRPMGPFFPGMTISAILGGIIYGVFLYKKPLSLKRIIMANATVTVFVNLLLNTYWMTVLYGNSFLAIFPARFVKELIMLPIGVTIYYTVAKVLSKAKFFSLAK